MIKKTFTRREILKIIQNNGFIYSRSTGGHDIYKKGERVISIPSNDINPMLFRRLMKENNLKEVY